MFPIKPHIWFDQDKAQEAAEFYASLMPDSALNYVNHFAMPGGGECEIVEFTVAGQPFLGISSGHGALEISPAISFMINFDPSRDPDASSRIDQVWNKLLPGGKVMMPLDRYPFSERYGWISDKYGVSWQVVPEALIRYINDPDSKKSSAVMQVMMKMKKIIIKDIEAAYQGA